MIQKDMLVYQSLDGQLRRMKRDLEKNEFRTQGKQYNTMRQETEDAINRLDARAVELRAMLSQLKQNFEKIEKTIDEYQKELHDIEDLEELNYVKKKLSTQAELLSAAERDGKNIAREGDEISAKFEELRAKMPKIIAGYNKCNEEFNKLISEMEPKINELKKQQSEIEKGLDILYLENYKKIRSQNIYPVYVPLIDGNRCGGCRMDMPGASVSKIDDQGFIRCEHCGRIIYKE